MVLSPCCWAPAVFSNIVPHDFLQQLAEADVKSAVNQVHEFYGDFYPVNSDFFTLDLGRRYVHVCVCAVCTAHPVVAGHDAVPFATVAAAPVLVVVRVIKRSVS